LSDLAYGVSIEEILKEHPGLEMDYIYAGLSFASKILAGASFVPLKAEAIWDYCTLVSLAM
jgi:uncharacterized protein (DUF433 family)